MIISNFLALVISAFLSWISLYLLIPRLRLTLPDLPNSRSTHCSTTPRGGGIVFCIALLVACLIEISTGSISFSSAFPLLAIPLAIVGLLDDRFNLPASVRFLVQFFTAFLALSLSPLVRVTSSYIGVYTWTFFFIFLLLIFVCTAVINFINFMDGLDGLVAGCTAVSISSSVFYLSASWPSWALVGSLLGFLFFNWSPASVFMGDVGSTFLGAVLVVLVLQASNWPDALALLLVSSPLLFDSCICVLRRLAAGQNVFEAHRLHLFQRLYLAGWSHSRVACLYIASTVLLAIALFYGGLSLVIPLAVLQLFVGVWLDQKVAFPFADLLTK